MKGSKKDAEQMVTQLRRALSALGLILSPEKTKLTNINSKKVSFLGTNIHRSKAFSFSRVPSTSRKKRNPKRLRLEAPLGRVKAKLTEAGFLKRDKSHPKFIWMSMSHRQILDRYMATMRGILNYYSFTHNYGALASTTE